MSKAVESQASPLTVNKADVARSFSLAAATYDQVADLQRRVAETLYAKIPERPFRQIADLGCGTGHFAARLAQRFQGGQVFGLDIAQGMLEFSRNRFSSPQLGWCCADAESLPFKANTFDLIFSSLAVQWCGNFPQVCRELMRVLQPGGVCVMATLGPETLRELRSAWQQVDGYVHVNRFLDAERVKQAALGEGLACRIGREDIVMAYSELRQLTNELKALGAHNLNNGRPKGLTGRQRIEKLKAGYETFRSAEGILPATYEVYYLVLEKRG
ncbi:MAG: malonyl-ACP O-methyltransferase BioC [Pseudomonadales bacterium]